MTTTQNTTALNRNDQVAEVSESTKPRRRRFSTLKKILLGVATIIVVFVVVVALQPSEMRVTRSATILAPPSVVFAKVNDFHNWEEWSPWAKLDPAAKNSFDGPSSG